MRIDLNLKTPETSDPAQTAKSGAGVGSGMGSVRQADDTTVLSPDQSRVRALAAQLNGLPEIRQEKVAALGRAVQSGIYQIKPQDTADALLSQLQARPAA
jgi:flagellar biosynthesis anti-sigma factor FlgM